MTTVEDQAVTARTGSQPVRRLAVVAGAAVAAVVVWLVATQAFGVDLQAPAFGADQPNQEIGIPAVLLVSLFAGLAGWGALALLERLAAARARLIWTIVAGVALLLSLSGPMSGTGVTAGNRSVLVVLHLVVGAVLITGLLRAGRARRG